MAPARSTRTGGEALRRLPGWLAALLPGALTVYLAFNAGGFFIGAQATVAIVLILLLAVRAMAAGHPARWSPLFGVAALSLALFATWTLLSGAWSGAPFRALASFGLVLLYLATLVTFGSLPRDADRLRMVRGVALSAVIVCGTGLVTRLLPDVLAIDYASLSTRLSYPVSYWNAFGLLAALGAIMCFGLTSDEREPRLVRILTAAALPVLGAALLLTLSRGSIAAGLLGLLVFAIVGHPRGLLSGLLAAAPATTIAVAATYNSELLMSGELLSAAVRAEGEDVARTVALCALGGAVVRSLLLPADGALERLLLRARTRRTVLGAAAVAVAAALALGAVAADVPRQYDRFVEGGARGATDDPRARLTDPANGGRIPQWTVALEEFHEEPVHGRGAGTYELSWALRREAPGNVRDAHSLYLEVMGELGLVGLVLVVIVLVAIIGAVAWRARGPDRALHATIVAAAIAWAAAAAIEWHWEMPVVTLWLFALGGAAMTGRVDRESAPRTPRPAVRVATTVACCALIAVVPVRLAISQAGFQSAYVALAQRDCPRVHTDAAKSLNAVGTRPELFELLAACELRSGHPQGAARLIGEAIRRGSPQLEAAL
jgi:O-antigen ligase